jgi:hypothetical protein
MDTDPMTPIGCDTTDTPDTEAEHLARYGQLVARALVGRAWTPNGPSVAGLSIMIDF